MMTIKIEATDSCTVCGSPAGGKYDCPAPAPHLGAPAGRLPFVLMQTWPTKG